MGAQTTRRALFAAAPAIALAAAVPAVSAPANPDAALLALGESFRALVPDWRSAERLRERLLAQMERDVPTDWHKTPEGIEAYKLFEKTSGLGDVVDEMDRLGNQIDDLAGLISDQIATTPAGLKIKARLAMHYTAEVDEAIMWGPPVLKALIEDVLALEAV